MRFCRHRDFDDDLVTDERLADFADWLTRTDLGESLHLDLHLTQYVVRMMVKAIVCYGQIQHDDENTPDPRESEVYQETWETITARFPRSKRGARDYNHTDYPNIKHFL
ncbi:hypothetical protein IWW54_004013 [Coemansia sp. RSA 2705]|nr:hypothetical protein IWW54_004013 [Coemansia sp. RSA 2705]